MDAIRIENLRSLGDTGFVQIRPITLLVGQNSSGKSTFLRTVPLLRQSVESRTSGPILWYGPFVDFGSFKNSLTSPAKSRSINIHFQIGSTQLVQSRKKTYHTVLLKDELQKIVFTVSSTIVEDTTVEEGSYTGSLSLDFFDHKVSIQIDREGNVTRFLVNSQDLSVHGRHFHATRQAGFLPYLSDNKKSEDLPYPERRRGTLVTELTKKLQKYLYRGKAESYLYGIADSIGFGTAKDVLRSLKTVGLEQAKIIAAKWNTETPEFKEILNLVVAQAFIEFMLPINTYITDFYRNSKYIAPLRATAERYYRLQDLAVDEVDFQGRNLAMYLRSLTLSERQAFSDWTSKYLGFASQSHLSGGHISLNAQEAGSNAEFNIADMGFGYSQALPILTQLWSLSRIKESKQQTQKIPVTFAIEQPELHLHPRLQAKLADGFWAAVDTASQNGIDLRLLIETHSEALVNRLGHLVAKRIIQPDQINVVLFNKEPSGAITKVQSSGYDENGILRDWPYGFFEPDED